jgi:hypothetical protein
LARDEELKERWDLVVEKLSNQFADGDKLDLMHIAICKVLEPYGFYEFDFVDDEGWPHYKVKAQLPHLKAGEQSILMKEAIVNYFVETEYID